MSGTNPLTTGQAARYCHVSQGTIINWIRKGTLKAYATPGGHYRILLPDFLSFLETYRMPVDAMLRESSHPQVLIVSNNLHAERLIQTLQGNGRFDVAWAGNEYEASAQVARLGPDAVVFDMTSPALDCLALCRWLRVSREGAAISMLAVGDPEDEETARAAGADAYVLTTAVSDRLEEELATVLASKPNGRRG
jgi:excisionase family DNA binding protein